LLVSTLNKISKTGAILYIAIVFFSLCDFHLISYAHPELLHPPCKQDDEKGNLSRENLFKEDTYHPTAFIFSVTCCFCVGGYVLCVAIGLDIDVKLMTVLVGSLLVADVVGFAVLITPGDWVCVRV